MYCNQCGRGNPVGSSFCSNCGKRLQSSEEPALAGQGREEAESFAGRHNLASLQPQSITATGSSERPGDAAAENGFSDLGRSDPVDAQGHGEQAFDREAWQAVIGHKNTAYYLPSFEAMERTGAPARWHWPAFFVTWYWLLYRKMWALSFIYLFAPMVVAMLLGAVGAAFGVGDAVESLMPLAILGFFMVVPPLLANGLYYKRCRRIMDQARSETRSRHAYLAVLSSRGGTSGPIVVVVVSLFLMLFIGGILAAIAIPAYQDYTKRAKVAEALWWGRTTVNAVVDNYRVTRNVPRNLADLPGAPAKPSTVGEVIIDPHDGTVYLQVLGIGNLSVMPQFNGNEFTIECGSPNIDRKLLPSVCRSP